MPDCLKAGIPALPGAEKLAPAVGAKTSVGKDWGEAPSLVEGIPARITLPLPAKAAEAWALDERGQHKTQLPVQADATGSAVVTIGPQSETLWYEVAIK